MQKAVEWWCALVGVIDPGAIHIAVGIVAGGTMLYIGFLAFAYLWMGIAILIDYSK